MKTTTLSIASVAGLLLSQVCVGQEMSLTSIDLEGTITWENAFPEGVAWVEQLTDIMTTGSPVTVTETLGVSDGFTTLYNYTVEHPPIVDPSVTISQGTNSWNDETGSSPPGVLLGSVGYPEGTVVAIYLSNVPAAGTPIQLEYSYRPVTVHQEWLSVYAELPTSQVSQAVAPMSQDVALYRVRSYNDHMVLIPAGTFQMGDAFNDASQTTQTWELPVHTVFVSAFYIDALEVSKAKWDAVYSWAVSHGYDFDGPGRGKAPNHPVQYVSWYDCVKWCNAKSEMEGRTPAYYTSAAKTAVYRSGQLDIHNDWVRWDTGYRLPTEAEWEKAARGGASGRRFSWGNSDTIQHSRANYRSTIYFSYDTSPTQGAHPDYDDGVEPYTSPVGSFLPNGYGVYDTTGNVHEWNWDWFSDSYYETSPGTDPRGSPTPPASNSRMARGGGSGFNARNCRVASRTWGNSPTGVGTFGFRAVLPAGP
jgi:formylglycine-generating enzyme required for sulfatase activity